MAELMTVDYVADLYEGDDWASVEARAEKWLTIALSRAKTVAPCLIDHESLSTHIQEAARGIVAGAVLRLVDDAKGNTQYQTAGPFSHSADTKLRSDRILSIPDRDELRQLCRTAKKRRRGGTIRTPIGY